MKTLLERMAAMDAMLAPYAAKNASRGRVIPEELDGIRTPFQRDRARVIHSQAFRRLAGKTQVFVAGEGDHFRTRLTHTMEVAQITRDLARALGLNEDLAECIALAHDLGHPPFGHAGQDALDAWMNERGKSFEHNVQSHRIVTVLEQRGNANGLNLTRDVVEGLLKHGGKDENGNDVVLSLESQLANACDEIAYVAHDSDDGLRAQLFSYDELRSVPLAAEAADAAKQRGILVRSTLIDILARDLIAHAAETERANGVPTIGLSPGIRAKLQPLRAFLWERMYHHPLVLERMERGQAALRSLCETFLAAPPEAVAAILERTGGTLEEAVKDHVAGMTDGFATREAARLV